MFNIFYNILNYILNDIVELDLRLTVFYNYIAELLELHKISKKDIQKYLDDKLLFDIKEIFRRLSIEYYNLIDTFLFQNITILSFYYLFDYKIKLFPNQIPLYHRLYTYSLYKLLIICKYLDKHLEKSFIKANKSFITASILLTYKPKGDIYIYIDYKGLNNIIIKNRYLIPLIYETLDILYHIKIYIKLDIITIFNYLYIASRNE